MGKILRFIASLLLKYDFAYHMGYIDGAKKERYFEGYVDGQTQTHKFYEKELFPKVKSWKLSGLQSTKLTKRK